jgi:hypothetical protein
MGNDYPWRIPASAREPDQSAAAAAGWPNLALLFSSFPIAVNDSK